MRRPSRTAAREEEVIAKVRKASSRPAYAEGVYRQLIELAKAVQEAAPASAPSASIDEIRAAIGRIDEQLLRELDRATPAPIDTWKAALKRSVSAPGVDSVGLERLAVALEIAE